ncbi:MAG TPA: PD-(D/E)XK nuclease family protein, partial [Acetobacteraceae bacterium]|nr:PD-(D/E)XK nuclease family protein [Acetobacteraceae bacterium]
ALLAALEARGLRAALLAWWRPRLCRIAAWVAATEIARRADAPPEAIAAEVEGRLVLPGPAGDFLLVARADRIERRRDGFLAILDYKTGAPPAAADVRTGHAPQLTLEAAMASAGSFGPGLAGEAAELAYWHMTGATPAGTAHAPLEPDQIAAATAMVRDNLIDRIAAFDDPHQPYLAAPHPGAAPRFSDYAQLARVAEWASAGDETA